MRVIVTGSRDMAERYDTFMKNNPMFVNNQTLGLLERDQQERRLLMNEMDRLVRWAPANGYESIAFIHGACGSGADKICSDYCAELMSYNNEEVFKVYEESHPADWKRWGRRAGPIRNTEMVELGADYVIACWNGIVEHSGTFQCFQEAVLHKIPVKILPIEFWNVK